MLQLTIDGQRVNVSPNCSFEIVKSNPFLTKIGEYSYDIDIDLRDPQNAKIYGHIERLHSIDRPKGRIATLMDGPRVICRGTEVILEIDGTNAKIQILAGNSDFNYFIGGDGKIRDLDFGTMPSATRELANKMLTSFYPDANFGFPEMNAGGYLCNKPDVNKNYVSYSEHGSFKLKPQPYVLYYVEKLVELLGYELSSNYLVDDPRWQRLIIIDNIWSLRYADHLPDWTISEFVNEVEKFFNCVFLYDSVANAVKIVSLNSLYSNSKNMEVFSSSDIIGPVRKAISQDDGLAVDSSNIRYNLPDGEYYSYADLPEEVEKVCSIKSVDIKKIKEFRYTFDQYAKVIYRDTNTGVQFAFKKESMKVNNDIPTYAEYLQVNQFKGVVRDKTKDTLELNIVPCQALGTAWTEGDGNGNNNQFCHIRAKASNYTDPVEKSQTLNALFLNGVEKPNVNKRMEVCFYLGTTLSRLCQDRVIANSPSYYCYSQPILLVENYFESLISGVERVISYTPSECGGASHMTLSLDGEYGRANTDFSSQAFNSVEECTINLRTYRMLDPMSLFNIDNRLFFCKELRYKVEKGALTNVVEGKFYPALFDE